MSQGPLPTSTILLIEADPSLRRLIMLGLSHSGMHVIEACSVQELPALDAQALDLLIVDVDQGVKSDWSLLSMLREQAHIATLPIVVLSWENPAENKVSLPASLFSSLPFLSSRLATGQAQGTAPTKGSGQAQGTAPTNGSGQAQGTAPTKGSGQAQAPTNGSGQAQDTAPTFLSKPFDARALHSTIAKLLAERAARKAAQLALVEAQVLASYEQHAAPSIWPMVTAVGLLLMVTGLLLQLLIAIVGLVLVLISLLVWTLGAKPVPSISSSTVSTMTLPHSV